MANPVLHKVVINSVDVSDYITGWNIAINLETPVRNAEIYSRYDLSDVLVYADDSIIGKTVEVYRGSVTTTDVILFRGYVRKVEEQRGILKIVCEDKLSQIKYTILNESFDWNTDTEAGVISEIFKTCINSYTTLVADNTSVQNSGSINIIKKFRFRRRLLSDGLLELATALGWQFYYDPTTDKVFFEPKGYTSSTTVLSVGNNILKIPKWDFDSTKLFNKVTVIGAPQDVQTQEGPHKLDGTTTNWSTTSLTLQQAPITVKVLCDTNATPTTEKTLNIPGTSSTYDYSVDKYTKNVEWNTSVFAPTTSYYATVQYTFLRPITIVRRNQSSIDNYSGGVAKEQTIIREDLQTVDDCARLASAQLAIYSTPFVKLDQVYVKDEQNLEIGKLYNVDDSITGYNYTLLIRSITYSYPYRYDIISLSDQEYRVANWDLEASQRLKRIEEQQVESSELITSINDLSSDLKVAPRHIYVNFQDTTNDTIWGRFTLGSANWDGTYAVAAVEQYRFPGESYFEELLYDSEYYDSGTSTGVTWNTTTRKITITAGSLVTNPLTRGVTIISANIQLANASGDTYTVELSCDGGNTWQTINSFGVRVPITTTSDGTTTLLRVTTSGTTYLENTYKSSGDVNNAAIAVFFEV